MVELVLSVIGLHQDRILLLPLIAPLRRRALDSHATALEAARVILRARQLVHAAQAAAHGRSRAAILEQLDELEAVLCLDDDP
jgi:hypothetical protein